MQTHLIKQLNQLLKAFPEYWEDEDLKRYQVINDIKARKPELIKALISNDKIKSLYSSEIDGVLIFDFHSLINLLQYKEYWPDSFTKYRNSVGLSSEGKYLNYNSDVVLDFPFKDCVLEGGMSKEEQGKNEVYYNEIIARDEIDRLFSPKVFTNVKRYTKNGAEENVTDFSDEDNLIIKGNNLIALHSLKERYAGKVKLIYIDPPYNTGNDGFKYNDRFNHSTWLTFMKNRLEVARELLRDDGVIFISIDDNEHAYLKILIDSIFGEVNFILNFVWKTRQASGKQIAASNTSNEHEYILSYAKNKNNLSFRGGLRNVDSYSNPDNDPRGIWAKHPLDVGSTKEERPNCFYTLTDPDTGLQYKANPNRVWAFSQESMQKLLDEKKIIFNPEGKTRPYLKKFFSDLKSEYKPISSWLDNKNYNIGYNTEGTKILNKLFANQKLFDYPKPVSLIKLLLQQVTKDDDIILDYHAGSGTTAHAVFELNKEDGGNRKFIMIEQMDYINNITVPRIQKVIDGEQGGISKDVNWQGGGSFVYAELKELNYTYINEIQLAKNYDELVALFEKMKQTAHLNYQVELEKILNTEYEMDGVTQKVAFKELLFDEQKRLLIELLDKNQLYVNADDMNDENLKVSKQDKAFTNSFYGKK